MEAPVLVRQDARLIGRASQIISRIKRWVNGDRITQGLVFTCTLGIVLFTALLICELWVNSAPSRLKFGWSFLFGRTWDPLPANYRLHRQAWAADFILLATVFLFSIAARSIVASGMSHKARL